MPEPVSAHADLRHLAVAGQLPLVVTVSLRNLLPLNIDAPSRPFLSVSNVTAIGPMAASRAR